MNPPARPCLRDTAGFTLIELMITVAVAAIIAAVAIPSFQGYVQRGKIVSATAGLGDLRTQMEKFFMDNRTYLNGGVCGVATQVASYTADPGGNFTFTCAAAAATTYTLQAAGKAARGMGGFTYTIDQANNKRTVALPSGWSGTGNTCWVVKSDGSC